MSTGEENSGWNLTESGKSDIFFLGPERITDLAQF